MAVSRHVSRATPTVILRAWYGMVVVDGRPLCRRSGRPFLHYSMTKLICSHCLLVRRQSAKVNQKYGKDQGKKKLIHVDQVIWRQKSNLREIK
jgi:hypothetical protein